VTPSFTGRLLVAAPLLRDPNFERSVVLVVEHGEDGALGVVLNRPSDAAVSEILPTWDYLAVRPPVVFLGGPVALNGVICLGTPRGGAARAQGGSEHGPGWRPLFGGLGTVDLDVEPDDALTGIRVFAGHAGWGPAQLEGEVEAGGWFVVDAVDDDAFSVAPESLWPVVLRRQGGALARLANFPDDPASN